MTIEVLNQGGASMLLSTTIPAGTRAAGVTAQIQALLVGIGVPLGLTSDGALYVMSDSFAKVRISKYDAASISSAPQLR
jgi:hypothetical protein